MKPFRTALPAAHVIMRLSLSITLLFLKWPTIKTVNLQQLNDIISLVYVIMGILLAVGGFLKKSLLTLLSALVIFILTLYFLYLYFPTNIGVDYLIYLWPLSISLFYWANGNNN